MCSKPDCWLMDENLRPAERRHLHSTISISRPCISRAGRGAAGGGASILNRGQPITDIAANTVFRDQAIKAGFASISFHR